MRLIDSCTAFVVLGVVIMGQFSWFGALDSCTAFVVLGVVIMGQFSWFGALIRRFWLPRMDHCMR